MSEGREQVKVSVRNLVEFVLRSGDIDNRRTAGAQKEAMLAGSRIHRKIQKRQGPEYRAEVPLKFEVEEDGDKRRIYGRGGAEGAALCPSGSGHVLRLVLHERQKPF